LLARRARGEPIAYLVGTKGFWSLELEVTSGVLIPRPETELVVELALARLGDTDRVLDLGTGSGAIALAIAKERPRCRVTASDVSATALDIARHNAARLSLDARFIESDWFSAIEGRFDVIVCNPPYVAADDPHLGALVYEPRGALVAGHDGLGALRRVIADAPQHLVESGALIVEHGSTQGTAVRELFARAGFVAIATHRDLAGHERVTAGRR
jgi:release factor glutamine methyltransferase